MDTIVATALAEPTIESHRSRWGYHTCDRETFLELKELHRYALHDLRASKRLQRWEAKLPHNRGVTPPRAQGTDPDSYSAVLWEYRRARTPWGSPPVEGLSLPGDWRGWLAAYREFWGKIRYARDVSDGKSP